MLLVSENKMKTKGKMLFSCKDAKGNHLLFLLKKKMQLYVKQLVECLLVDWLEQLVSYCNNISEKNVNKVRCAKSRKKFRHSSRAISLRKNSLNRD